MAAEPARSGTPARRRAWLSHGLEALVAEKQWIDSDGPRRPEDQPFDFDVVIVGSGYGGSVAAAELSGYTDAKGKALRICVLERGNEYLQGMFPSMDAELAGWVRFATPQADHQRGLSDGLF